LEAGQCHLVTQSRLGRDFKDGVEANLPLLNQYKAVTNAIDDGATSTYFSNPQKSSNREVTVTRNGLANDEREVVILGANCREDPRTLVRVANYTKSCAEKKADFNLVQLSEDDDSEEVHAIPADYAASVTGEAAENEKAFRYKLTLSSSVSQDEPRSLNLELLGHGGGLADLPENVLFTSVAECEAYRKDPDAVLPKPAVQRVGFVQLFEVRVQGSDRVTLNGLQQVP
jgi:hypothetical protein